MSRITNKPHLIFLLSIPVLIIMGILSRNEMLDVNVHDIYWLYSQIDLTIVISILFGVIGLGYWIIVKTNRKLYKWMTLVHVTLTLGGILLIWTLAQFFRESVIESEFNYNLNLVIYLIVFITLFGQIIYPINIISGIIRKRNKTSG